MTYIENALYDFVKTILTRGIKTLLDFKYLPYTLFLIIIVVSSTIAVFIDDFTGLVLTQLQIDLLLYVELSAALGFIVVGLLLGKLRTAIQMVILLGITIGLSGVWYFGIIPNTNNVATLLAALLYVVWITIAAFSTFSLFRDLFENDVLGMVLFLGKPKDDGRPMFRLVGLLFVFLNAGLGYFIYINGQELNSTSIAYSGLIVIILSAVAFLPLLNIQKKYDVFFTILTSFFIFTTIRVVILAFKSMNATPGQTTYWETIFSFFIALYAIQNAAVRGIKIGEIDDEEEEIELSVEERLMAEEKSSLGISEKLSNLIGDKGIVLSILGAVIGFHTMQVQSFLGRQNIFNQIDYTQDADIIILGYEVNLAVSLLIYVFALLAFITIPKFRDYANPTVRRIEWAPEYDDFKSLVLAFKEGDLDWKSESLRLAGTFSSNKIKGVFSSKRTLDDMLSDSVHGMLERVKNKELDEKDED